MDHLESKELNKIPEGAEKKVAAIKIENLTKSYQSGVQVLKGLSFEVAPGEIFGLLGPNGAGKTSVVQILAHLQKPDSGCASVCGFDVTTDPWNAKPLLGVVPQEVVSHGFFNILEILDFHSGYYGLAKNKERIEFLVHRLGLWDHRSKRVNQLSGGMKRRLMIAKALVHSPKVLLLDEPTAGVDVELRTSLWDFVRELQAEGTSVLLTTHYLHEAEELCDRIGVLDRGQLIYLGAKHHLVGQMSSRHILLSVRVKSESELNALYPELLKDQNWVRKNQIYPHCLQLEYICTKGESLGEMLKSWKIQWEHLIDVEVREGSLEQAMMNLLKSNHRSEA